MNATGNNGNNKTLYWISGAIFAPLVLAVFGNVVHLSIDNAARLNALEKDTEHRLQRIERKLDRLLEAK